MRNGIPSSLVVVEDAAKLAAFARDRDAKQGHIPRALVKAAGVEDIKQLLRWANTTSTGVIPVSSTGQRRRGDTVPAVETTVIADLSGMRKLTHVDPRDKIAIIEPGIDFGSVDDLLRPHGLRAYRPLKPRAGKSVIASYLEREPLINPNDHWDVGDPFGGTGLVLGSGDFAPTGAAAIEGSLEQQLARGHRHMVAPGPTNLDLLRVVQGSQGSLGIMAWAAVYCERIPSVEESWFATADNLEKVTTLARTLVHRRIGTTLFIVDRVQLALLMAKDTATFSLLLNGLPPWTLFITLSGARHQPVHKVAWQRETLASFAASAGVTLEESLGQFSANALGQEVRRSENGSFRDRAMGEHKELFFLQSFSGLPVVVDAMETFTKSSPLAGKAVGTYIQPMAQGTYCHIEFTLPCNSEEAQRSDLHQVWGEAAVACADAGAFFSRPYAPWQELAFDRDTGNRALMNAAKSILDPGGVMNPGRLPYGDGK